MNAFRWAIPIILCTGSSALGALIVIGGERNASAFISRLHPNGQRIHDQQVQFNEGMTGIFEAEAIATLPQIGGDAEEWSSHFSNVQPNRVTVEIEHQFRNTGQPEPYTGTTGSSGSGFVFEFGLTQTETWQLDVILDPQGYSSRWQLFELFRQQDDGGASVSLAHADTILSTELQEFHGLVTLVPGNYLMYMYLLETDHHFGFAPDQPATPVFTMTLDFEQVAVPEPSAISVAAIAAIWGGVRHRRFRE
ncbi:MAG: hypothetical protein AB7N71_03185 [Phycisphaerae bacterium]